MERNLKPYLVALERWLPGANLTVEPGTATGRQRPDAVLRITVPGHPPAFIVEHKAHVATQDIQFVIAQIERRLAVMKDRGGVAPECRRLLLAPYIRPEQAAVLRATGVDYLDLAGNAHLEGPGLLVHVEGRKPDKAGAARPRRLTNGWVKTVLALLARPELRAAPYRRIAAGADVALGTVNACMKDLEARGHLDNGPDGRVLIGLPDLVALWVQTYGDVLRPRLQVRYFQMREREPRLRWMRLADVLARRHVRWALTGADGAALRDNFFQAPETEVYADPQDFDDRDLLHELDAQPAARHGNLWVIHPPAPVALPAIGEPGAAIAQPAAPPAAPLLLVYAELRLRRTEQANEAADLLLPELAADARA